MVETITFSRVTLEDLDLGSGTRSIRLQDGSLHTLQRIPGRLDIVETVPISATAAQILLTATSTTPAGARIHGVTVKVTTALGTSNSLTSFDVGDSILSARWGSGIAVALNTETDSSDFQSADEPIVAANYAVHITGNGGTFDGTGAIDVQIHYSLIKHRS